MLRRVDLQLSVATKVRVHRTRGERLMGRRATLTSNRWSSLRRLGIIVVAGLMMVPSVALASTTQSRARSGATAAVLGAPGRLITTSHVTVDRSAAVIPSHGVRSQPVDVARGHNSAS